MEPLHNMGIVDRENSIARHKKWQEENKDLILKKGDCVKMGFDISEDMAVPPGVLRERAEHMWVCITDCDSSQKTFRGTLENDPILARNFENGDKVKFKREEIEAYMPA